MELRLSITPYIIKRGNTPVLVCCLRVQHNHQGLVNGLQQGQVAASLWQ